MGWLPCFPKKSHAKKIHVKVGDLGSQHQSARGWFWGENFPVKEIVGVGEENVLYFLFPVSWICLMYLFTNCSHGKSTSNHGLREYLSKWLWYISELSSPTQWGLSKLTRFLTGFSLQVNPGSVQFLPNRWSMGRVWVFFDPTNGVTFGLFWTSCFFCCPCHPWDWYIYLHEWLIFMVNVGKYAIHGCYGLYHVLKGVTKLIIRLFLLGRGLC